MTEYESSGLEDYYYHRFVKNQKECEDLFELYQDYFSQIAHKAIRDGKKPEEIVVLCIKIDPDRLYLKWLAEKLLPDIDLSLYDPDTTPLVMGVVNTSSFIDGLHKHYPAPDLISTFEEISEKELFPGKVVTVIMSDNVETAHLIDPIDTNLN